MTIGIDYGFESVLLQCYETFFWPLSNI